MKQRLGYLDSIRGIAASIVVFGHFSVAYTTGIISTPFANMVLERRPWLSPLILLEDCDTAVCLFFVLSGFVLTKVFSPYIRAPGATLAGRAVRLFVPGFCACTFGCLVLLVTHHLFPSIAKGRLNDWTVFLKDTFISMPLLGYQGLSIFDNISPLSHYIAPLASSANEPLWSLSVEWQGSLLIFALTALQMCQRRLWLTVMLALGLLVMRDWFVCFLFGHLVAIYGNVLQARRRWPWVRRALACLCIALDLFACLLAAARVVGPFNMLIAASLPLPSCEDPTDAMRLYAAMLIFTGIFILTELHPGLEHPALAWLGRMSFPIYLTHFPIITWAIPIMLRELPPWFWGLRQIMFNGNIEIEYPRAISAAFLAMIVLTVMAASVFLRIDGLAISAGHKLRTYLMSSRQGKTNLSDTSDAKAIM